MGFGLPMCWIHRRTNRFWRRLQVEFTSSVLDIPSILSWTRLGLKPKRRSRVHCPRCQHADCKVIESRPSEERVGRRRQCQACNERFTTMERIEYKYPMVVKKGGTRQNFSTTKLLDGFRLACRKRPVTPGRLDEAVERVSMRVRRIQWLRAFRRPQLGYLDVWMSGCYHV